MGAIGSCCEPAILTERLPGRRGGGGDTGGQGVAGRPRALGEGRPPGSGAARPRDGWKRGCIVAARPVKCRGMKSRSMRHCGIALCVVVCGCTSVVSSVTGSLAEDLSSAILDSEDLAVVRDGAPAYLIMLDALLRSDPQSPGLLAAAASLNAAYGAAFVEDPERQRSFADKALRLASRAACETLPWTCTARTDDMATVAARLSGLRAADVPVAYAFATAWAGWIQAHSDDWGAVAELGRVKSIMIRIAELDEAYDHGGPRMYLGVFETLVPAALGGRPELGREHFERAIGTVRGPVPDGSRAACRALRETGVRPGTARR